MIGKNLSVGYAIDCGDAIFTGLTYLPLGSINDKQLEFAANTDDNTNDLSGGTTSELVVNSSFNLSVSGFLDTDDDVATAQNALVQFYWDKINAGEQTTLWLKISGATYPRVWHIYMVYKGSTEGHGTTATSTMSFDFGVTDTGSTNAAVNLTAAP